MLLRSQHKRALGRRHAVLDAGKLEQNVVCLRPFGRAAATLQGSGTSQASRQRSTLRILFQVWRGMPPLFFGVAMQRIAITLIVSTIACLIQPSTVLAQTVSQDEKARARAERHAQGADAARMFKPGEGDPIPAAKAKVSRDEREKSRQARKSEGSSATKSFRSAEGDPRPPAVVKAPVDQRRAERSAKRRDTAAANMAGQIPNYGENYAGQK
ncbi:hypothetical protein [Variovorax sp. E3]|uniref:hypothetical protein n=1 Tax=Variovorax sp. E3 TaxID=1914993 RepID=UPI0018DCC49C|nr:hypothetical protein [Variovorax sp. E3]